MLDRKILKNPDKINDLKDNLIKRKLDVNLEALLQANDELKKDNKELENLLAYKNRVTASVYRQIKDPYYDDNFYDPKYVAVDAGEALGDADEKISELNEKIRKNNEKFDLIFNNLPNIIDQTVPTGQSEQDNVVVDTWVSPNKEKYPFRHTATSHYDYGLERGWFDFERAVKISQSRFTIITSKGARLERAIAQFMLDQQVKAGFNEMAVPYLVNEQTMFGTGQLPKFKDDLFASGNLYLIPTAEVPLTNLYRDEVLEEKDLTIKLCSLTPCFRKEAGSYGKDTKGILRQHQFNKVELVMISNPNNSATDHITMRKAAENILKLLELPYRVMQLCSADLGFSAAICYDLEVWLPSQQKYREISSCSNCTDFQARRSNIRFRNKQTKKLEFVHTLNGSGLAVGRTLIALIENHQLPSGKLHIPEPLRPYLDGVSEY